MYIELDRQSRNYSVTTDTITQTFVYAVAFEDLEQPDELFGQFFQPNDDAGIAKFVYATFPIYRIFPIDVLNAWVLILTEHSAEDLGGNKWRISLTYSIPSPYEYQQQAGNEDYVQFSITSGGDTININRSRDVTSRDTATDADPPDNQGCIRATKNSIEGADIFAQGLRFSITTYYSPFVWSINLLNSFYALTSCYNNAVFYGFSAGEVLLISIDAQGDLFKRIPVTFNFLAKPNINGVADTPFPVLYALGHDVLDYTYERDVDENVTLLLPHFRYVHRVYQPANFSLLGL